jgi:hypothetical protein
VSAQRKREHALAQFWRLSFREIWTPFTARHVCTWPAVSVSRSRSWTGYPAMSPSNSSWRSACHGRRVGPGCRSLHDASLYAALAEKASRVVLRVHKRD